jgi:hypothetical protein
MQPDVQNQGYAAGVAAAMAAEKRIPVREIDVRALQEHLVQIGNLPERVLTEADSYPIPQSELEAAVRNAAEGYRNMALILGGGERSLPLLREAYEQAPGGDRRLVYAHILAMLGDPAGLTVLMEQVGSSRWDKGWNFRGMGQYGASISPLDSYIVALGRTGDRRAVETLAAKARELGARPAFSHCRALAMAFESIGDPSAAVPLAELLAKPSMSGHAVTSTSEVRRGNRNAALREIVLARALYRCGDHDGLGERILREYANDVRGHYARHTAGVLAEGSSRYIVPLQHQEKGRDD